MTKKKILHVEDNADTLQLVKTLLTEKGYKVIGAKNGRDGLKKAKKEKPDLILLDIMMPDMSGWDVFMGLKKMKSKSKVAFLSVVECSAARLKALKKEGVIDYILKPFDAKDLQKRIKKIVG